MSALSAFNERDTLSWPFNALADKGLVSFEQLLASQTEHHECTPTQKLAFAVLAQAACDLIMLAKGKPQHMSLEAIADLLEDVDEGNLTFWCEVADLDAARMHGALQALAGEVRARYTR